MFFQKAFLLESSDTVPALVAVAYKAPPAAEMPPFFMPSFGRKRLGLASTARQAGEGHKRIDSTVSVRALPGGFILIPPGGG